MFRFALHLVLFLGLLCLGLAPCPSQAAPTSIVYTGQLLTSTSPPTPANGAYDFQFQLFNAATGGTQVGPTVSLASVPVVDGIYQVQLSFGNVFTGQTVWLQVSYRVHPASGSPPYTALSPRQVAPNSAFADYATLSGSTQGLQSKAVSAAYPTTGQVLTYNGTLWAPAALPAPPAYTAGSGLTLSGHVFSVAAPLFLTGSSSSAILQGNNSGAGDGVYGANTGSGDYGFLGGTDPKYSAPAGVFGNDAGQGNGVLGLSVGGTGSGVSGVSDGGFGVLGNSTNNDGVQGDSASSAHSGVAGLNSANGYGVFGASTSGTGTYGGNTGNGDYGFLGGTDPKYTAAAGVFGSDAGSGNGVLGLSAGGSGSGVSGVSDGGFGVLGVSTSNDGMQGQTSESGHSGVSGVNNGSGHGVFGVSRSSGDYGFLGGTVSLNGNSYPAGVVGSDTSANGNGGGGYGVYATSANGFAVGATSATSDAGNFVSNGTGTGLFGSDGVYGGCVKGNGVEGYSSSGYAGYFSGNVVITGGVSNAASGSKIDHPLDPAGKYLYHASVESDKMEDVYHGHVTTDGGGSALVTMPSWFQALNTDFEYQLTVVGQFAQAVVATEIQNNQFTIKTDHPNVKVSWQVTGVRHDSYAQAHPLQVEQEKPAEEQGLYLHPVENGQPESLGIGYVRRQARQRPAAPARP